MKRTVSALVCALTLIPLLLAVSFVSSAASAPGCLPDSVRLNGAVPAETQLDAEQAANARTIVDVVVRRRMPTRAAVVALATALQESDLRNIPFGDRDSLGLFQQRASQGWGGPDRVMNPVAATNAFLDHLSDVPSWPALPLTVAAQAVQRSAFPDAYAKWEPLAATVVDGLLARPTPTTGSEANAADTPGLFVLGDGLLANTGDLWPTTFQGGPTRVDADAHRVRDAGVGVVQQELASAPGTVVISLGPVAVAPDVPTTQRGQDRKTPAPQRKAKPGLPAVKPTLSSGHHKHAGDPVGALVTDILRASGDRTVYWFTSPGDAALNAALGRAAAGHPRLQVVDMAAALTAHPGWLDGGALSDTGRTGTMALIEQVLGTDESSVSAGPADDACADGVGGYSAIHVPDCGFSLARGNPRSCANAIRWALAATDGPAVWRRKCLHFVARAYGWSASGIPSASAFWSRADERHLDTDPPAGALVFWSTGSPDGHVALSLGRGLVASNDIDSAGTIAAVPLTAIAERWHAIYLGWSPPAFGHGI